MQIVAPMIQNITCPTGHMFRMVRCFRNCENTTAMSCIKGNCFDHICNAHILMILYLILKNGLRWFMVHEDDVQWNEI
uniref:Uncharacterized protein n=1 Tax=Romanomermis culicivorax TaxID=13658 RepID=A0A915JDT6_ROMCU